MAGHLGSISAQLLIQHSQFLFDFQAFTDFCELLNGARRGIQSNTQIFDIFIKNQLDLELCPQICPQSAFVALGQLRHNIRKNEKTRVT